MGNAMGIINVYYLNCLIYILLFTTSNQSKSISRKLPKNGSYIPGIRPGNETERYIKKVVNRISCIGAISLAFIASLPVILTLSGVFGSDSSLAFGGTGLIIAVGVAIELNNQVNGLLAGKKYDNI